tara:strand:+ start:709 stop:1725 length:1017 start_codon:yes stop_codon:yes gene_type:complete
MIDVENYFNDFKPSFNKERFKELLVEPPKKLQSPMGTINIDPRLFKSILGGCRLLDREFDRNHIYYGGEGTGKSHTAFQHSFIWWWVLNELGMINYEFTMDNIVYGRVKTLMEAFDKYKDIPYVLYVLDESEELNRKNWNKPEVKEFMAKLRRERKNLRIVNLILPALEEILPSIALSRINWIIELKLNFDSELNPVRGYYNLFNIPNSYKYFSPMQGRNLTQKEIKSYLNARFYDNDKKFETLPKKLLSFTGYTNKTFVFDKEQYKEWSLKINNERNAEDEGESKDEEFKTKVAIAIKKLRDRNTKWAEIAALFGFNNSDTSRVWYKRNEQRTATSN